MTNVTTPITITGGSPNTYYPSKYRVFAHRCNDFKRNNTKFPRDFISKCAYCNHLCLVIPTSLPEIYIQRKKEFKLTPLKGEAGGYIPKWTNKISKIDINFFKVKQFKLL